ncbi:hypothetical protein M569_13566 [Genlisea aurea]|uniref:Uncharacterized protein n=1 Tax=Genlisea aurea TaxID=192259 RepID=S8C339_9LAMI|nr:hypothetical protein M569_13566 [Genlisea aurea]
MTKRSSSEVVRGSKKRVSSVAAVKDEDILEESVDEVENVFDFENDNKGNSSNSENEARKSDGSARFLGSPVPEKDARKLWPHRYTRGEKVLVYEITNELIMCLNAMLLK